MTFSAFRFVGRGGVVEAAGFHGPPVDNHELVMHDVVMPVHTNGNTVTGQPVGGIA